MGYKGTYLQVHSIPYAQTAVPAVPSLLGGSFQAPSSFSDFTEMDTGGGWWIP